MDSTDTTTTLSSVASAIFLEGFKNSLPTVLSYIPVALAFTLKTMKSGFMPRKNAGFTPWLTGRHHLFSLPAAIVAGIFSGCLAALAQAFYQSMRDDVLLPGPGAEFLENMQHY